MSVYRVIKMLVIKLKAHLENTKDNFENTTKETDYLALETTVYILMLPSCLLYIYKSLL